MRRFVVMLVTAVVFLGSSAPQASAIVPFMKEFQKLYITPETDEEFAELVMGKKTKCLVCHQGKKRKHHNPYGEHLEHLLDKKKDKKDKEKIIAALKKVEKTHIDPKDDKSPTYGDLIEANKLPGGPLKDVQKEPEKDGEHEHDEAGEKKTEEAA
jgi:hypothetical protein